MLSVAFILLIIVLVMVLVGLMTGGSAAYLKFGFFTFKVKTSTVFFLGMGTTVVLLITLWAFRVAFRRSRERRRVQKAQAAANKSLETDERGIH